MRALEVWGKAEKSGGHGSRTSVPDLAGEGSGQISVAELTGGIYGKRP
jgi:hypothetical protein